MNAGSIRVLLVDDHEAVRTGCRAALDAEPDLHVVAEAGDGDEAYRLYVEHCPDVVVLDLTLPGTTGLELVRRMLARNATARILAFTMHESDLLARRVVEAGACGFVTKTGRLIELIDGVRAVGRGEPYFSPRIGAALATSSVRGTQSPFDALTARELEIARLVAEGRTSAEIATALHVAPKTIANHMSGIRRKLDVSGPVEIARLALRHGLARI